MTTRKLRILALDLATTTGWAHSNGQSGVWIFKIDKNESSGTRLIRFEGMLRETIAAAGVDLIAFEAVNAMSGRKVNADAVKLIVKFTAIIEKLCEEREDIDCWGAHFASIKSYALGSTKGKGKESRGKEAMLAAAKKRWPQVEIVDDNQADAMWLLDYAESKFKNVTREVA